MSTHRLGESGRYSQATLRDGVDEYGNGKLGDQYLFRTRSQPTFVVQGTSAKSGDSFIVLTGRYSKLDQHVKCLVVIQLQFKFTASSPDHNPMNRDIVEAERKKADKWCEEILGNIRKNASENGDKETKEILKDHQDVFNVFGVITNRKVVENYVPVKDTFLVCEQNLKDRYPVMFSSQLLSRSYLTNENPQSSLRRLGTDLGAESSRPSERQKTETEEGEGKKGKGKGKGKGKLSSGFEDAGNK